MGKLHLPLFALRAPIAAIIASHIRCVTPRPPPGYGEKKADSPMLPVGRSDIHYLS